MGDIDVFDSASTSGAVTVVSGSHVTDPLYKVGYWTTWSTRDGINWTESESWEQLHGTHIASIELVPFEDGFAAMAHVDDPSGSSAQLTYVYLSPNGAEWTLATTLDGIRVVTATNANGSLIAAGLDADYQGGLWMSDDGVSWRRSSDPAAKSVQGRSKLAAYANRVVLISAVTNSTVDGGDIWVSDDGGATWIHTSSPAPTDIGVADWEAAMAAGPAGWVIGGWYYTDASDGWFSWWSSDGVDWQKSANAPRGVQTIVGWSGGFVAGGYRYSGPCCAPGSEGWGFAWATSDGLTWRNASADDWTNQALGLLAVQGRTLIGLTVDMASKRVPPAGLWLANLDSFSQ